MYSTFYFANFTSRLASRVAILNFPKGIFRLELVGKPDPASLLPVCRFFTNDCMNSERTNEEWLQELRAGSALAQQDLTDYLKRGLVKALGGRQGVDIHRVEDWSQDALLRILDRLDTFRGDSRFTTWAVTVAVRVALTQLRSLRWKNVSLDALADGDRTGHEPADPGVSPERMLQRRQIAEILNRAIATDLTEKQRLLIRAELAGMPQELIAENMGTNRNALYKLGHDARKKLKEVLTAAGITSDELAYALGGQ